MRKPITLDMRERVCFLKVIYSFFLRNEKLTSNEEDVLTMLLLAFNIEGDLRKEYQVMFFSNVDSMAEEINRIADDNARLYLLAIIKELYHIEKKSARKFPIKEKEIFELTYSALLRQVNIEHADVNALVAVADPDEPKAIECVPSKPGSISGIDSLKRRLGLG